MRRLRSQYLEPLSLLTLALAGSYLMGACSGKSLESGSGKSKGTPLSLEKEEVGGDQENSLEEQVGWVKKQGESFYVEAGSGPAKGWKVIGGKWCYFDLEGRLLKENEGRVDYKKDLNQVLSIEKQVYDEIYLYSNLRESGLSPMLSATKSYIEVPLISGPENLVGKLTKTLDEAFFAMNMSNWELIKEAHNKKQSYSFFSSTSLAKTSIRVFDSGAVTSLLIRTDSNDPLGTQEARYGLYMVDNFSGQLVDSKVQLESMGIDPLDVKRKIGVFIRDNSQIHLEALSNEGQEEAFSFNIDSWQKIKDNHAVGDVLFTNDILGRVFLTVEDGRAYIMALLNYFVYISPFLSAADYPQLKLVRIPFDYKGGKLKQYKNDHFFNQDQINGSNQEDRYPFTGPFDIVHLIYE